MSPVDAHATARMPRAVGDHLLDDRDEHRHPEILERPGVRVAAQLDPEIVEADARGRSARPRTGSCRPRPSRRRSRRGSRGRPIPSCPTRPSRTARSCACSARRRGASTRPGCGARSASRSCDDLQQLAARRAAVDRLPDGVLAGAAGDAAEDGAIAAHADACTRAQLARRRARPGWPRSPPASGRCGSARRRGRSAPRRSCSRCR